MSDESQTVYTIALHAGCEIRATLQTCEGKRFAALRTFTKDDAGEFVGNKKGFRIPADLLGDLAQAVGALVVADRRAQGYLMPGCSRNRHV